MSLLSILLKEQLSGISLSDLFAAIIIALLITILVWYMKNKALSKCNAVRVFSLSLYIQIVLLITILRREPRAEYQAGSIVPYIELGAMGGNVYLVRQLMYSVFNVILFVPLGVLFGLSWRDDHAVKNIVLPIMTGFLFSFAIELTQLISKRGVFELTDIFTNVIGTAIGVLLVQIIVRKVKEK